MNGTTNFMLTKMAAEGASYAAALAEAQSLGFAEADPTADVEGHDVQVATPPRSSAPEVQGGR